MEINGIIAICTNCDNLHLLSKVTVFFCINIQPEVTKVELPSEDPGDDV